jgi:acetoacetate decarboxylase
MNLSSQDSKQSSLHQHCLKYQPFLFPGTRGNLNHTPPSGDYGTNKEMIFIIIRVRIVIQQLRIKVIPDTMESNQNILKYQLVALGVRNATGRKTNSSQ